jgi:hypothetical protein
LMWLCGQFQRKKLGAAKSNMTKQNGTV